MGEQAKTEEILVTVAVEAGAELIVEQRRRSTAPMPTRKDDGSFTNRKCPHCRGERFAHSYGDELCRCASCGATLDVDELII